MAMVLKKMGRVAELVFGSYIESVEFREAMVKLVAYAVVFAIGYHLNLVFGDDRIAPLLDGYAMTSLFAGLQFLSGAMDRTILVGGCLVVLFSLVLLNFNLFCNDNACFRIFAWSATLSTSLS